MQEITEDFLMVIAGDLEKLLIENHEQIAWAYKKIPDGIKLSFSISLDPSSQGIVVNYDMSFNLEPPPDPPEKHKVKYKHTIDPLQASMEFIGKELAAGKMSIEVGGQKIGNVP